MKNIEQLVKQIFEESGMRFVKGDRSGLLFRKIVNLCEELEFDYDGKEIISPLTEGDFENIKENPEELQCCICGYKEDSGPFNSLEEVKALGWYNISSDYYGIMGFYCGCPLIENSNYDRRIFQYKMP